MSSPDALPRMLCFALLCGPFESKTTVLKGHGNVTSGKAYARLRYEQALQRTPFGRRCSTINPTISVKVSRSEHV